MTKPAPITKENLLGSHIHRSDGYLNGDTAFLRYPQFQRGLIRYLSNLPEKDGLRILVVPNSVGCETWTLAALAQSANLLARHKNFSINALDISEEFTDLAKEGVYPEEAIAHLPQSLKTHFNQKADGKVTAGPALRSMVNILPASSLVDHTPEEPYDVVVALFLLRYVQHALNENLEKLRDLSQGLVCVNNLHDKHPYARPADQDHPFVKAGMRLLDENWMPFNRPLTSARIAACLAKRNEVSVFTKQPS